MVSIRTRVATVNIAFSSSTNAALTERKIAVHNIVFKTLSLPIERIENPNFTLSNVLACL